MPNLSDAEWMIVAAALLGPVLGVQTQKWLERLRESRGRKLHIFYALMGTRAARVSPDHVRALNQIDLEFYGLKVFGLRYQFPSEKSVVRAWRDYLDHLNQPWDAQGQPLGGVDHWHARGDDLFTELLFQLSSALDFDFDRVQLRRGIYNPRAFDENERAGLAIRNGLVRLVAGVEPLRVTLVEPPAAPAHPAMPVAPVQHGGQ